MRDSNPYEVLRVPRDADALAIEDAYEKLFDRYEPLAHAGDTGATRMLVKLNMARDVLLDPAQRADLDADFGVSLPDANYRQEAGQRQQPSGVNRRPGSVARQTSVSSMLFGVAALMLLAIVAGGVYFVSKNVNAGGGGNGSGNSGTGPDAGPVVATVNGAPIYQRDLDARYEKEKEQQIGDPLLAPILAKGGITSTRVFDVLKQDALDKLINFEVIMQQAQKEKLYPNAQTEKQLIEQAKAADVRPGQTFEESLREHGVTEDEYNRNVVTSAVYRVMANKYMPAKGADEERQNAFIDWICKTRESYDVKIILTFITKDNGPCLSGLPSDVSIFTNQLSPPPDQQATVVPLDQPTQEATLAPLPPSTPTASIP